MTVLNKYKHWGLKIVPSEVHNLDFVLSKNHCPSTSASPSLTEKCLSAYIDFSNRDCIEAENKVRSLPKFFWDKYVNGGIALKNIGYTGIDNGYIYYGGWDRITNKEFYDIFTTKSAPELPIDSSLRLTAVTGNTGLYSYPMSYNEEGYYELRGGFFQGFYKLFGYDYQVLPQYIEQAWHAEFVLRPRDYEQEEDTLNKIYPENKGIFFYMGTRAENKFAQIYNADFTSYKTRERNNSGTPTDCQYFADSFEEAKEVNKKCTETIDKDFNKGRALLLYGFLTNKGTDWYGKCGCGGKKPGGDTPDEGEEIQDCSTYWTGDDGYYDSDITLSGLTFYTSDGRPVEETGYYEIKTDNKFLTFNRTKYGFTTANWDEDTEIILTGTTSDLHTGNLFLLMNRTKSGYTVDTLDNYYSTEKKQYNFIKSIKGNAFALKWNEDGSIGFRYLIKDCDSETGYSVKEDSTYSGLVSSNEWHTVNVMFWIVRGTVDECGVPFGERKMRISIYIDGYLKYISKELPEFNFRELDDVYSKQEGVPFNISVGGGTQGLCDSVWVDYNRAFDKILPIEQNFAGTFVGDIKSFKFYTCPLEYNEIKSNYLFEKNRLVKTIY